MAQFVFTLLTLYNATALMNVEHRSVTQTCPEAFGFDIDLGEEFESSGPTGGSVYNPQLHEVYYFWNFGDVVVDDFTAPVNLLPTYLNANIGYGPKASHTYREAGEYNVSCLVVEPFSGKIAMAEMTITVGDQSIYDGAATIFVGTTGAPAGATIVTTLDAAFSNVFAGSQTTPRRIMIERGTTLTPTSLRRMGNITASPSVLICAGPGGDVKPIIDTSSEAFWWQNTAGTPTDVDLKWQDIEFVGPWDVTTQTGTSQNCIFMQENPPLQHLLDRCEFTGYNIAVYPSSDTIIAARPRITWNDTVATDWRSCVTISNTDTTMTGVRFTQNPQALNGFAVGSAETSTISPVRFGRAEHVTMAASDMYARGGWVQNNSRYTGQACFRGNTNSVRGVFISINTSSLEGGETAVSIEVGEGGDSSQAMNYIIEKNILTGYHDCRSLIDLEHSGGTVRNNIAIMPDVSRFGLGIIGMVRFARVGTNAEATAAALDTYNNTFVCLVSTANSGGGTASVVAVENGFTGAVEANNLNLQPNRGGNTLTNIDTTVLWPSRNTYGYRDDVVPLDTTKITPATTISAYIPQAGNAALGAATIGDIAYDTWDSATARPETKDVGANQVST